MTARPSVRLTDDDLAALDDLVDGSMFVEKAPSCWVCEEGVIRLSDDGAFRCDRCAWETTDHNPVLVEMRRPASISEAIRQAIHSERDREAARYRARKREYRRCQALDFDRSSVLEK